MDGQSEQGISPINIETQSAISTHMQTLIDLSSQYFTPLEPTQTAAELTIMESQMSPFVQAVEDRYQAEHSVVREAPVLMDSFRRHNNEVLETALFYTQLFNLPEDQRTAVAVSATLHDIAKADPAPADIPDKLKSDYILLMHPEIGARITESLLEDKPEMREIIGAGDITDVVQAIRCHSGPIPGFMQTRLDVYNTQSTKAIELAEVDPTHTPSLLLLAADMMALGSPTGVKKIVQLREKAPQFRIEDVTATIQEKRATTQEIRIESALKSAYDGAAMVRDLMKANPMLKQYAENNFRLMMAYFEKTKSELLSA